MLLLQHIPHSNHAVRYISFDGYAPVNATTGPTPALTHAQLIGTAVGVTLGGIILAASAIAVGLQLSRAGGAAAGAVKEGSVKA